MSEQEKREAVIKAMEHCIGDNCNGDKWSECEYSGHGCIDALLKDAIALLKAQETVLAVKLQNKKYIGRTGIAYDGSCGNCNSYLMRGWRACPICGKAVKWE